MPKIDLTAQLEKFRAEKHIKNKGALAVVLHLTRYARNHGLPLKAEKMTTEGSGQVLGLGKTAVQNILSDHGIVQVLAEEGGRTSRGSLGIMQAYVEFLNGLHQAAQLDFIESWWVNCVREHFAAKPFRLRFDPAAGFQAIIADLLAQAHKRQREASGTMYQGIMLQHLIGAKLELALPEIDSSPWCFSCRRVQRKNR